MSDPESEPRRQHVVPSWVYAVIGGGVVVVVVLIAAVVVLVARNGGSPSTATPTIATKTFNVDGRLDLISASIGGKDGGDCHGIGGFSDIDEGTQVVIRNSAAKSIGVGQINSTSKLNSVQCMFVFNVPKIPVQSDDIYSIQISHRDGISFHQADAGSLELTLGEN